VIVSFFNSNFTANLLLRMNVERMLKVDQHVSKFGARVDDNGFRKK